MSLIRCCRAASGLLLLTACTKEPPPTASTPQPGMGCTQDSHCVSVFECVLFESYLTSRQLCTRDCESDEDCGGAAPHCGIGPGGRQVCMPPCGTNNPGTCVGAQPVACDQVGPESCDDCGCPADQRCVGAEQGCVDKVEVGEACASDDECRSDNCSQFDKICRVPIGAPCSGGDCDECVTTDSGNTYCTRECSFLVDCPAYTHACLGVVDHFTCTPTCNSLTDTCDGTCEAYEPGKYYCDCDNCTTEFAPREVGGFCRYDSQCTSDDCYAPVEECEPPVCEPTPGTCTVSCTSQADCDNGTLCVSVPCPAGSAIDCGLLCLPPCGENDYCAEGFCRGWASVDGPSVSVCDPKIPDAYACNSNAGCASGVCTAGACAPVGGATNGAPCSVAEDCASGLCQQNNCRGSGLLGDACTKTADCSVGSCCSSGLAAGTCADSCS